MYLIFLFVFVVACAVCLDAFFPPTGFCQFFSFKIMEIRLCFIKSGASVTMRLAGMRLDGTTIYWPAGMECCKVKHKIIAGISAADKRTIANTQSPMGKQ